MLWCIYAVDYLSLFTANGSNYTLQILKVSRAAALWTDWKRWMKLAGSTNRMLLTYYSQERTSATKGDWNTAVGICPRMAIAKRNMTLHRQARIDVNAKITNRWRRRYIKRWRYFVSFAIRYSDLLVKNRDIFIPHLYSAPAQRDPVKIARSVWCYKTRMIGTRNCDDMLSRFDTIRNMSDRRTDIIPISI